MVYQLHHLNLPTNIRHVGSVIHFSFIVNFHSEYPSFPTLHKPDRGVGALSDDSSNSVSANNLEVLTDNILFRLYAFEPLG